uniref:Type II toxin-antitoxin system RelE/ParE family toxin n=1 Tax=Angiostrongylus cantonensis TaxID=6313 RepID=A0A0K0D1M2_ANGCA
MKKAALKKAILPKHCDPREVFRAFFHESDRLNVILDIIAIGAPSLNIGDPGVRIVIPKFEDINTDGGDIISYLPP